MTRLLAPTVFALVLGVSPALAASEAELDELFSALRTGEILQILADEGITDGEDLRQDMLGGRGGLGWNAALATIYSQPRMEAEFRASFDDVLADTDITPLLDFFASDLGERVTLYEVEGRRAMADDDVEEAAKSAYAAMDKSSKRIGLLDQFTELNDLIDHNVAGAMTSNLAFFNGLVAGGGFEMEESEILATVWGREEEIRADTTQWLGGYLTFTYERLSDTDLETYFALSDTPAGRDLNRALFAGFYDVFKRISFDLGKTTSGFMMTEEL